ncbi:MAG: hypothetical protein HQL45_05305 [Alphaproteobacteria bacterium]|nr:hypothetical protein [Alphaproteobacteria bacterium]
MTLVNRSGWAKTPEETVDWEQVFEAPENGLIALLSKAHSPQALRQITMLIIQQLYIRKDDPAEVARFTKELGTLIPDDLPAVSLPHIVVAVTDILRNIKNYRINKAAEFAREKARERVQKSRDGKEVGKSDAAIARRREAERTADRKRKRFRMFAVAASLVALAVVGGIVYKMGSVPDLEKKLEPNRLLVQQMTEAAKTRKATGPNAFGGKIGVDIVSDRAAVTVDGIPQDACMSVSWVLLNRGFIAINGKTSNKFGPTVIKELCSLSGGLTTITWVSVQ